MAIIDLGMRELVTGLSPVTFDAFSYQQQRAYAINALMTTPDFNLIYSYVRVKPRILPNGEIPFLLDYTVELEVIPGVQLFYLPASSLFQSNGDVILEAERLPRWRGAGDARPMTLQLTYDDNNTTQSWR